MRWFETEAFWLALEQKIYGADQASASTEEARAVTALLQLVPCRLLDMCCGNGRHAIALAESGFRVTAVDLNQRYLELGANAARERGVEVEFIQADMRQFVRPHAFDAALIMWNAFGYFENDEEDLQALRQLHASLAPGGKLLIQTHGKESTARKFVPRDWFEIPGGYVLDERWIEDNWSRMRTRYIVIDERGSREHLMSCRLYSASELTMLLAAAGFESISPYGGLNGTTYDNRAHELVVTALKPIS